MKAESGEFYRNARFERNRGQILLNDYECFFKLKYADLKTNYSIFKEYLQKYTGRITADKFNIARRQLKNFGSKNVEIINKFNHFIE